MSHNLIIKNAALQDFNGLCDIVIKDGKITAIEPAAKNTKSAAEVYDAAGLSAWPGFVDLNCHICDPGFEHKEDIITASDAAAKGGFTSLACNPLTFPVIDNKTVVTYIKNKAKSLSKVNIFPLGSMTLGGEGTEISEIGEMYTAGIVGVSDGNHSIKDANVLRTILVYSSLFDIPVIVFCEDKELAANGMMTLGYWSTYLGLIGKPKEAEEVHVARALVLARNNHARVHISHVSTRISVRLIRFAKSEGLNITCDTCPHYFTLTDEACAGYNTFAKVSPPLRQQDDITEVRAGLADGTIDAITSGHSPASIESKRVEFDRAAVGISSLETAFALSYNALVKTSILTAAQLSRKLSGAPAEILKLSQKGTIAPGKDADIVLIDETRKSVITASEFVSKAKFTPHEGQEVTGAVAAAFVGGVRVY